MDLRQQLTLRFARRLLKTPEGRAHVLNQVADAESNGENQVFEHVLRHVQDPALRKMIEKHQADEVRHEQLFRACLPRTGVDPGPVPAHLKLIDRLDRAVGGFFSHPIVDDQGVMEAYVMLQVIEERAIVEFAIFEQAFRDYDPATADVFAEVARDEARHLKYCHAISQRYAPSPETLARTLARYRALEARCFQENGAANLEHTLARGILAGSPLVKWFWKTIQSMGKGQLPYTRYATSTSTSTSSTTALAAA
jgi:rubrerythrin